MSTEHKRFATEVLGVSTQHYDELNEENEATIAAKRAPGRPAEMDDGKRRNIYIDDGHWDRALELGEGNASGGVRIALDSYTAAGRPSGTTA